MAQIELHEHDSGRIILAQKGDVLTISLEENPTTGFQWADQESRGATLTFQGSDWIQAGDGVGAGGIRILTYQVRDTGEAHIRLRLIQEWEPSQVSKRFDVIIRVGEHK